MRTFYRPSSSPARRPFAWLAAVLAALTPLAAAYAEDAAVTTVAQDAIRFLVEREVGTRHRVEVRLGRLDPRLRLAPCDKIEPFVPPAARLWGRTSIGVRCVEGARWSVLMPVTVSVFGPALVAAAPLQAGSQPTPADFRIEEVDLTREHAAVISDPAQLSGRVLTRRLNAGQALREDALRTPPTVNAGDPVRILLVGQGFTVTGEGVALSAAAEGGRLRVRTESGRVLVAPVHGRAIEIKL